MLKQPVINTVILKILPLLTPRFALSSLSLAAMSMAFMLAASPSAEAQGYARGKSHSRSLSQSEMLKSLVGGRQRGAAMPIARTGAAPHGKTRGFTFGKTRGLQSGGGKEAHRTRSIGGGFDSRAKPLRGNQKRLLNKLFGRTRGVVFSGATRGVFSGVKRAPHMPVPKRLESNGQPAETDTAVLPPTRFEVDEAESEIGSEGVIGGQSGGGAQANANAGQANAGQAVGRVGGLAASQVDALGADVFGKGRPNQQGHQGHQGRPNQGSDIASAEPSVLTREERDGLAKLMQEQELPALDMEIYFNYGSAQLSRRSYKDLIKLGKVLRNPQLQGAKFLIAGHTDAKGGERFNLRLSQRRAQAVQGFLHKYFKLERDSLVAVGYGEERLKNQYAPYAAENRRVQIVNFNQVN